MPSSLITLESPVLTHILTFLPTHDLLSTTRTFCILHTSTSHVWCHRIVPWRYHHSIPSHRQLPLLHIDARHAHTWNHESITSILTPPISHHITCLIITHCTTIYDTDVRCIWTLPLLSSLTLYACQHLTSSCIQYSSSLRTLCLDYTCIDFTSCHIITSHIWMG